MLGTIFTPIDEIGGLIAGGVAAVSRLAPSVWRLLPIERGRIIESALGGNLPKNFPVIDKFENGIVTSIKSVDLRAPTYLNPGKLQSVLGSYVDRLASFQGATHAGVRIDGANIAGRVLEIAVPPGAATAAQQAVFHNMAAQAAQQGVRLIIVTPR